MAGGATERGKVTYVPSRDKNADCFEERQRQHLAPLKTFKIIVIIITTTITFSR
jgi:hypothetical protein